MINVSNSGSHKPKSVRRSWRTKKKRLGLGSASRRFVACVWIQVRFIYMRTWTIDYYSISLVFSNKHIGLTTSPYVNLYLKMLNSSLTPWVLDIWLRFFYKKKQINNKNQSINLCNIRHFKRSIFQRTIRTSCANEWATLFPNRGENKKNTEKKCSRSHFNDLKLTLIS